jgi:UDP-N-acetylmuramoyl-L-alanyl-D-glutamate--2,6-diaminopimelate ligase
VPFFELRLPPGAIVKGLEAVTHVPGRLERVECGQEYGIFIDGARTPDRLAVALQTVKQATRGRVICVCGAPGERHKELRPLLGRVAERSSNLVILTSDDPRHEQPLRIAHDLLDGFSKPGKAHVLPNREAAIRFALSQAKPGDSVLVAGKGDRNRQIIAGAKQRWNEREVVERLVRNPVECRPQLRVVG